MIWKSGLAEPSRSKVWPRRSPAQSKQTERLRGLARVGLVAKAVEKRKRTQDTDLASAESFVFSEEEVEQIEQKEKAAASSSHAVLAKGALEAGPEKKRGNQSRGCFWGPFFLSRSFQLGGRQVGAPSATCIWTSMIQVTLVARNPLPSACAATPIKSAFSG